MSTDRLLLAGRTLSFGPHSPGYTNAWLFQLNAQSPLQLPEPNGFRVYANDDLNVRVITHQVRETPLNVSAKIDQVAWGVANILNVTALQSQVLDAYLLVYPLNHSAFAELLDPVSIYQWQYPLPRVPYPNLLIQQPELVFDLATAPWLQYQATASSLQGTPAVNALTQARINIYPKTVFVNNVGVIRFQPWLLNLCILAEPRVTNLQGGGLLDQGRAVQWDETGGVWLAGSYTQNTDQDVLLLRCDAHSTIDWVHAFGSAGNDVAHALVALPQQRWALTGQTDFGNGTTYGFVAAVDAINGSLLWLHSFGGAGQYAGTAIGYDAGHDALMVTGVVTVADQPHCLLLQLNQAGEFIWSRHLANAPASQCQGLVLSDAGTITVVGSVGVEPEGLLLLRFTTTGELLQANRLDGAAALQGYALCALPEQEGFMLAGAITTVSGSDALLVQVNMEGEVIWAHTISTPGDEKAYAVALNTQQQVLLTGYTDGLGAGEQDILLMAFTIEGEVLYRRTIGSGANDLAYGLVFEQGINPVLAVTTAALSVDVNDYDAVIIKLNTFGQLDAVLNNGLYTGIRFSPAQLAVQPYAMVTTRFSSQWQPYLPSAGEVFSFFYDFQDVCGSSCGYFGGFINNGALPPVLPVAFAQPFSLVLADVLQYPTILLDVVGSEGLLPQWLRYDLDTQTLTGTPTGAVRGLYSLTFSMRLNQQFQQASFVVNVTNSVPYLTTLPIFDINIGRFVIALGALMYDNESDRIYPYGIAQNQGELAPSIGAIDTFSGRLFGTALSGDQGSYIFNVTASDPYATGWQLVMVNVRNRAPERQYAFPTPAPVTVRRVFGYSFPDNAFVDLDGDLVGYAVMIPSFLSYDPSSRTISGTPDVSDAGNYSLTVVASDFYGGNTTILVPMSVLPNFPPVVVNGLPNQSVGVNQVKMVLISHSAFKDPESEVLSYQVVQFNGQPAPDFISFASNTITFAPRSGKQGTYRLSLDAIDPDDASTSSPFTLVVPNQAPQLVYPIPAPAFGYARQPRTYLLEAGNFVDADQDPLVYLATLANGSLLPGWIDFDPARRLFQGTPAGIDRGTTQITVSVSDAFGGIALGQFSVTVGNSAPAPEGRIFDQQVSQTETSFTFTVSPFDDPDGDTVSYRASMSDGEPLMEWIQFDPVARTFSVAPKATTAGNYLLTVMAIDSLGLNETASFNLAIQAPPTIDLSQEGALQKLVQYLTPVGGGIALLGLVGGVLAWRQRRIRETEKRIERWSKEEHLMPAEMGQGFGFSELRESLEQITRQISEETQIERVKPSFREFVIRLKQYYQHAGASAVPMTSLLEIDTVGVLMNYLFRNTLEVNHSSRSKTQALAAAQLLQAFLNLVLAEYSGRGHKVPQELKETYDHRLDKLMTRLRSETLEDIRLLHELTCAREAIICMRDTNTLSLIARTTLVHVLSPGELIKDIKTLLVDIPARWYVLLLEAEQLSAHAQHDQKTLAKLQTMASRNGDWRFRFGMIRLLVSIVVESTNPLIRAQAIHGQQKGAHITQLGLLHLLQGKNTRWHRRWVIEETIQAVNDVAERLATTDRHSLSRYIKPATRTERVTTVLEMTNPLHQGRAQTPFLSQITSAAPSPVADHKEAKASGPPVVSASHQPAV